MTTKNKCLVGIFLGFFGFILVTLRFFTLTRTTSNLIIFLACIFTIAFLTLLLLLKYKEIYLEEKVTERNIIQFELEEKYNLFFFIVDSVIESDVKEFLDYMDDEDNLHYRVSVKKHNYLSIFEQKINDFAIEFPYKDPDDFIIASFFMYSLLEDFDVIVKDFKSRRINLSNKLMVKIAFDCALQFISKSDLIKYPSSFEQIQDKAIYDKILNTLMDDFFSGIEYPFQFSNILYLLDCQD